MWMVPVAIASGNTFLLKPSEKDAGAAVILAKLAIEAGLPPGVLNIVRLRLLSSALRATLASVHFVAPLVCLNSLLPSPLRALLSACSPTAWMLCQG